MLCSICNEVIEPERISGWEGGHNAEPINSGRCCTECNWDVVLPARIKSMVSVENVKKRKGAVEEEREGDA